MGDASSSAATHPTEDRRLKIAGLALIGAALPGFAWLALRFDAAGAWQRDALLLAGDALVLIVCANLATIGLLILLSGFGRRDWWRDARARRAAIVKLAGANVLLPVLVFSMLQDDRTVSALLEEDWIAGAFALAAWVLIALGASTLRRASRHEAATADEAMRADPRAPVVYLRSFQDDGQMLLEGGQRWWRKRVLSRFGVTSTEQELAFILERIGPVIAIGKPGEPLPELGAARLYVAHEHWQQTVIGMLRRAAVVAIRIGASAGVRWEIERTLESVPRARILFIVLGDDEGAAQAARQLSELLGVEIAMPARPSRLQRLCSSLLWSDPRRRLGTLICFARDGTPIVEPVRAWPKHAADLVVMLLAMRPTAGPLRDAFRRVYAHWGRAWHEHKSRGIAIGLALLLGGFGAHWFYLGRHRIGFVYLLFVVVAVPIVLAWIDALRWILMDRARFDERVLLPAALPGSQT